MQINVAFRWAVALAVALPAISAAAQTPGERMPDRDVKEIIEAIDRARDRFEDQLDGNLKSSIIRNDKGEVSVERYLDDLQENVKNLKERFTSDYSASREADVVLRQGSDIHTFIKSKPAEIKGGSEWDTMARELGRLAGAYRTTFPVPKDAIVRRINDREAADTAEEVAKTADDLRRQLEQEKMVPKTVLEPARQNLQALSRQARTVKDRAGDARPATAEMRQLVDLAQKVGSFMGGQATLLPGTTGAWKALQAPLEKLGQAYGLPMAARK